MVKVDENGPNSIEQSILRIVCLDWDQFGSDDVLGQIELTGWQIKQLAESKYGDEVVTTDEGAIGEADMETVFEFVQRFQEHEMDPVRLGKMIVRVPQDPVISKHQQDQEHIGEATQVQTRKKKKRDKKLTHGGGEREVATQGGADRGDVEVVEKEAKTKTQSQEKDTTGLKVAPTSSKARLQMGGEEKGQEVKNEVALARESKAVAVVVAERTDPDGHSGGFECQVEGGQSARENEGVGRPCDQTRLSEVGSGSREGCNEAMSTFRKEHTRTTHNGKISPVILNIDALATETGGMDGGQSLPSEALPEGDQLVQKAAAPENEPGVQPGIDIEEGGAQGKTAEASYSLLNVDLNETKAGRMGGQPLTSEAPPKREVILESGGSNRDEQLAPDAVPENTSIETPDADVEEGCIQLEKKTTSADQRTEKRGKLKARSSVGVHYRDGKNFIVLVSLVLLSQAVYPGFVCYALMVHADALCLGKDLNRIPTILFFCSLLFVCCLSASEGSFYFGELTTTTTDTLRIDNLEIFPS